MLVESRQTDEHRPVERDWLIPVFVIVAVEMAVAMLVSSHVGFPAPPFLSYFILATVVSGTIGIAVLLIYLAMLARAGETRPIARLSGHSTRVAFIYFGFVLVAMQMASLTGLKSTLTLVAPFWADPMLADLDAAIFFGDPWKISHALFGWATPFIDIAYLFWIPLKFVVIIFVLSAPASRLKSQAMISYALIWAVLGMVAAYPMSSAGPVFFQDITGSERFAPLLTNLEGTVALNTASILWANYDSGQIAFGSGISAMPSMHVAIALWMALVARGYSPFFGLIAFLYFAIILIGSVHLAWHYALDGIVSSVFVLLIWKIAVTHKWFGRNVEQTAS